MIKKARFVSTVSLNEEEMELFEATGLGFKECFMLGVTGVMATPATPAQTAQKTPLVRERQTKSTYSCGCKYTGEKLCPKHGRV